MILQYSNNGTECYEEAQSICFLTIPLKEEKTVADVIQTAAKKIEKVWGDPVLEIRSDKIILPNSKVVKFSILSERDRGKSRILMFNENTPLFLLNDNGKTLKMF